MTNERASFMLRSAEYVINRKSVLPHWTSGGHPYTDFFLYRIFGRDRADFVSGIWASPSP